MDHLVTIIDLIPQYEENLLNYYKFSITNDNNKLNLIAENVTEVTEDETIDNFPFYQYSVQAKTIKETNENSANIILTISLKEEATGLNTLFHKFTKAITTITK